MRSLLVERHPGTAIQPKSRGINPRTMEVYRQCGVEDAIRDAGLPTERTGLGPVRPPAGAERLELPTCGFGIRCSTN